MLDTHSTKDLITTAAQFWLDAHKPAGQEDAFKAAFMEEAGAIAASAGRLGKSNFIIGEVDYDLDKTLRAIVEEINPHVGEYATDRLPFKTSLKVDRETGNLVKLTPDAQSFADLMQNADYKEEVLASVEVPDRQAGAHL